MDELTMRGKVAIVTGAGSGLGEATTRLLASSGGRVACVDVRGEAAERVARECAAQDAPVVSMLCDVKRADQVFATVDAVVRRFGRLDAVVNCAGIDRTLSVAEMTVDQWDEVIAVNLRGPFLFAKAAWPTMRRQQSGHIVNIASTAATRAWANAAAYHASKWGIVGFSRGLGVEGRGDGIRVTTIIPGGMRTHFFDRFVDQGVPMPDPAKLQDPRTVAQTILWALQVPPESSLQEAIITPVLETSWP